MRITGMVCAVVVGLAPWVALMVGVETVSVEVAIGFGGAALSAVTALAGKKVGLAMVPAIASAGVAAGAATGVL